MKIKPMSKSQIASAFGINGRTLRRWFDAMPDKLKKRIPRTRAILQPALVKDIFLHLGEPE